MDRHPEIIRKSELDWGFDMFWFIEIIRTEYEESSRVHKITKSKQWTNERKT